ncbi:hypothetical protein, partial [Rhizobium leguminosarum]|uniref:hypothetical protein n=1 Tax=Rhizobium leguminosarum TaxID=384 RepID=UPI001C94ED0C
LLRRSAHRRRLPRSFSSPPHRASIITHHIKQVVGLLKVGTERTHHHANLFTCENVEITFSNVRKPRVSGSNLLKATDLKRNSVSPRISDATSLTEFLG